MNSDQLPKHDHAFAHLVESFFLGITRLQGARIVSLNARLAVLRYRAKPPQKADGYPYEDVLAEITKIARSEYEAYEYVTDVSHLTYATTLLDTFLSDCTKFLLLLHPGAIGKNHSVTLDVILAAESRAAVLTQAASKKVRELGHLPFLARVEYLQQTFGLSFSLDEATSKALAHYSDVRNAVVHDQGIFEAFLEDDGTVDVRQKTCPVHPTRVGSEDLKAALEAYSKVFGAIATAVIAKVLKGGTPEWGRRMAAVIKGLDRYEKPPKIES